MAERKKHYWYIKLEDISIEAPDTKVRELRDIIIKALKKNVHYASIIAKDGTNRVTTRGHTPDGIPDDEWIKVFDENGEYDIEATATKVVKDLLVVGSIISMRYEDEMYDIVTDKDKGWIDGILRGEDNE